MNSVVYSINQVPIRLTPERWEHILTQHSELHGMAELVLDVVAAPERILAGGAGELLAVRSVAIDKWIVVAYRELEADGFVITAFLTKRYRSLEKRFVLWQSPKNT